MMIGRVSRTFCSGKSQKALGSALWNVPLLGLVFYGGYATSNQFREIDANKDGYMQHSELSKSLSEAGYDQNEIDAIFKELDTNEDGKVSFVEFAMAHKKAKPGPF